jgi:hypothetical protein
MRFIKSVGEDRFTPLDFIYDDIAALFGMGTENNKFKIFLHSLKKSVHVGSIFEDSCFLVVEN